MANQLNEPYHSDRTELRHAYETQTAVALLLQLAIEDL